MMSVFNNLLYIDVSTTRKNERLTYAELNELDDDRVGLWVSRRIKLYDFFSENIGFDREIAEISGFV